MFHRAPRLRALFLLAWVLQLAVAHSFNQLDTRQDGGSVSRIRPAPKASPGPDDIGFRNGDGDFTNRASPSPTEAPRRATSTTSKRSSSTGDASDSPTSTSPTPAASASATGDPGNPMFVNATIPAGQLPLAPEITPGWGVSGVIMLLTGLTYTLVGIKNRWIHTFFSTAYITALGVAVLIVYVMTVPVSNAVQGGYVVAVVMSGCAVGAASMFFKELTEGLGCALGGFSVSMWLLCLVPGGLLRPVPAKAIFISSFTLVGFAFYFSRWTRDWALILTIAFSGATITILGLDCFTRAGLKEFWAYIWDVNGNLFPLGSDTYPVTKGIRVEAAAIVIIFLMGIISQIKLWRIVREKREKRAVERAEGQRNLELEEENVGRQIEEANARERRQWERVYGHGLSGSGTDSRMSDLGDIGSEKKLRHDHTASYKLRSSVEAMDMAAMSESDQSRCGGNPLMAAEETRDGKVTVRVGADDVPDTPTDVGEELDEKVTSMAERQAVTTSSNRLSQRTATSKRASQAQTVTEAPEVVPLPFCVPAHPESRLEDDRSSIATFAADDAERSPAEQPQRRSLAKRLSRGSLSLLRSISQMSGREDPARDSGDSLEELVVPKSYRRDDNESLAATIDGESVSGDDGRSAPCMNARKSIEINAKLSDVLKQPDEGDAHMPRSMSPTPPPRNETSAALEGKLVAASPKTDCGLAEQPGADAVEDSDVAVPRDKDKAKSTTSASSTPASLTKDRLPRSLSRVAMSYRTNEWAKHLSYADTPDLDELRVAEPARPVKADKERSVPVNVTELQKRADEGTPDPVIIRSDSRASNVSYVPSVSRHTSRRERPSSVAQERDSVARSQGATPGVPGSTGVVRSTSSSTQIRRSSSGFKPAVAAAAVAEPIPEERPVARHVSGSPSLCGNELLSRSTSSVVPGVVSYNSPQTLIGQRDMFLRSKSQGNLIGGAQEPIFGPASDAASVYSSSIYAADPDDIPLSQRKQIMRQSSLMSLPQPNPSQVRLSGTGFESSDNLPFNSHQPRRVSTLPTQNVRDAQLANFRQSVQHDLRSGTPVMSSTGRETPFAPASLLGNREAEVQRNIEMQRNVLMGQKEAEAQRKESQRREREFADRAFDERMRTGDLLEAHRDAMRKMQKGAREQ